MTDDETSDRTIVRVVLGKIYFPKDNSYNKYQINSHNKKML